MRRAIARRIFRFMTSTPQRIALTIAGSDSSGGAGIQADLKTFARFGLFGTSVITAVTAQNTVSVRAWERVTPSLVRAQIDAVATDLRPAAIKSGMLGDAEVVRAVAAGVREHRLLPYVLDPVMVATSGDPLLASDAVDAIVSELFPLATLVTPNLDEASLLVGAPVRDVNAMEQAARTMVERFGARAALVKGGHLDGPTLVDVYYDGSEIRRFTHATIYTRSTHGTGCALSSAIAAFLATGRSLENSIAESLDFVHRAIATAPALGAGHGPLNFFA
jgi:hydroxymethylpyrimidine/phosphomethylpyrimidine kinase